MKAFNRAPVLSLRMGGIGGLQSFHYDPAKEGEATATLTKSIDDIASLVKTNAEKMMTREEGATLKKSLDEAQNEIKVLKSRELDKPGLGLFKGPLDFYHTAIKAGRGQDDAKKLIHGDGGYVSRLKAQGQNEGVDSQGGIFVLPEYSPDVLRTPPNLANIRSRARVIQMMSNLYRIRALVDKNQTTSVSGGLLVGRGPEAGPITPTRAQWEWIELKPTDLTAAVIMTNDVIEDATAFASYFPPLAATAIENQEQEDFLFGDGAGEPLGALSANNPSLITTPTRTTVNTIKVPDILAMRARTYGDWSQYTWIASQECIPAFGSLSLGSANFWPLYMPSIRDGSTFDTLMGAPIIYSDHMEALGTANDLALVNWSQYAIGDRGTTTSAVNPWLYFLTNETVTRWVKRNDGQPLWRAALTPVRGATRSPFINLSASVS